MLNLLDDIFVCSMDITENEKHLGVVLNILKDNKLFGYRYKCVFGHRGSNTWAIRYQKGVEVDGEKVKAMIS